MLAVHQCKANWRHTAGRIVLRPGARIIRPRRKNSVPAQTVKGWATAISPDQGLPAHPSEAGQALDYIVTNNNPGLFAVAPAIDSAGTLTFTPAVNASGVAQISVRLHDGGGTPDGGVDTSAAQTFNITITDGTTTSLTVSTATSVTGESVTLSVLVTSNNPTTLIPDGTVTFVDSTNAITLATNVPLNASGQGQHRRQQLALRGSEI